MAETRTYKRTHPWITFQLDLQRVAWSLWTLLGECQSKCEHIAGVPLRPDTARRLYQIYLGKGALASAAIEGNTLTEDQVQELLEGQLQLPASQDYLEIEIKNIVHGCEFITKTILNKKQIALSPELIVEFNRIVLDKLELAEGVKGGEFPLFEMGVGSYKGAPKEDRDYLLQQLCDWINDDWRPDWARKSGQNIDMIFSIMKAVVAHVYFEWIHPFGDGNGRTGRLIEFFILVAAGAPLPVGHLLSNHYNITRANYYRRLTQSSKEKDGILSFLTYAVAGLFDGLQSQLKFIREQQIDVHWRNYVYELLSNSQGSEATDRQRRLILDLSRKREPVPKSELTNVSPRVAATYAKKTPKTLSRDINKLKELKLIREDEGGFVANIELILAFLPPSRDPSR